MNTRRAFTAAAALLVLLLAGAVTVWRTADTDRADGVGDIWSTSWSTAQTAAVDIWPNWSTAGFADETLRQTIRPTLGGDRTRITLSNRFGNRPLRIAAATIADAAAGAAVRPGTVRPLTFDGDPATTIPPGSESSSDAADFTIRTDEPVTVTLYLAEATGPATFHYLSNATSYRAAGDHSSDVDATAFAGSDESWYYLSDLDVEAEPTHDGVVVFGDSITDGRGATVDADNRYPDLLHERLTAGGADRAVLNAGIAGNRVVSDSDYVGARAAARFQHDVLDKDGVGTVILLSGINDIGASELDEPWLRPNPEVGADRMITEYRHLVQLARADGLRIIGGTLLPYRGAPYFSERGERVRDAVNTWIRESGEFDAVIDFDRALADPTDPDALAPRFDSGDHLHPSPAGYSAMAAVAAPVVSASSGR